MEGGMIDISKHISLPLLVLNLYCTVAVVADPPGTKFAPSTPAPPTFQKEIRPLLEATCFKCHGPAKKNGGIDFSAFTSEKVILRQHKLWRKTIALIEAGEMPPAGQKPLSAEQRQLLLTWMKQTAARAETPRSGERDPGPAPLRRLTQAEYNLTIRDLLGLEFNAAEAVGMPDDGGGEQFDNLALALKLPPALLEKYFAAADMVLERLFLVGAGKPAQGVHGGNRKRAEQGYQMLLCVKPGPGVSERDAARQVLTRFARRAFRRPVAEAEVERLVKLYDHAAAKGGRFEDALRLSLKAVLLSPHFLYRIEQDSDRPGPARITDHELATRLSYFLWSSMPDDVLFALADKQQLSDAAVVEKQIKRMLADPKAQVLTERFAAQWLQIRKVHKARPSTEFFPTFTHSLRRAMYDETATFFDKLRAEDRSVLELLDADYTYLNQELAAHYGIAGVAGQQMRRVQLKPEDHRGGLLGMASMLALTSHTSRTSPTLRGKWILEVVFGTPPPPPPPDAGMLKEEKDKKMAKTFREQLALHATSPACAGCHKKMDPLGFALDNYDAVGRWRDQSGGQGIDTSGQLPTGEKFNGAAELKRIILNRKGEFVGNMTEQLLSYALGRELEYHDDFAVKEVTADLEKTGYRFSSLVLGIVRSYPFQYRRGGSQ
jgi:Protein of unknown function (DUF1592)/Protein of unknown function (DUF1588)/Protein of unknown function (DUF1595)/Protein of unknown function (DUF1585)/Protein of unknown function (DUF1587)/Planctomycete cytochrome C